MDGRGGWERWTGEVDGRGGQERWMEEVDARGGCLPVLSAEGNNSLLLFEELQ